MGQRQPEKRLPMPSHSPPPAPSPAALFVAFLLVLVASHSHAWLHPNFVAATRRNEPIETVGAKSRATARTRTSTATRLPMSIYGGSKDIKKKEGLKIAVVGAGPSGLLLSHLLLNTNHTAPIHKLSLFDGRSDPRTNHRQLEGRAYSLGIGIRGRTAIRSSDPALWEAIRAKGYETFRFHVHLGLSKNRDLVIPLRSDPKPKTKRGDGEDDTLAEEPSLLIYQSELCATLLETLEEGQHARRSDANTNPSLELHFNTKVVECDLDAMTIRTCTTAASGSDTTISSSRSSSESVFGPFDLIVGCDGVNSRVRDSIDQRFPEFVTTKDRLPGYLKVVRLGYPFVKPSRNGKDPYDPKAVKLLLPSGAFVIPTGPDGSSCILLTSQGSGGYGGEEPNREDDRSGLPVYLTETQNATAVHEALRTRFPRWTEDALWDVAQQLLGQDLRRNSAFKVTCNTYHYRDKAVLVGDAAHSTGGVSGQGLNSALVDALVLAECLQKPGNHDDVNLHAALLEYSMQQVPEGLALYELFFGPNPQGFRKQLRWGLKRIRDGLFQGRFGIGENTLRTRLSSELTPFSTIRRERDYFYKPKGSGNGDGDSGGFPSQEDFRRQLEMLHNPPPRRPTGENHH